MSVPTSPPRLKKDTEAAEFLGLSPSTLRQYRIRGRGPAFIKLGSRVVYRESDLLAYVERNLRQPTAAVEE